MIEVLGSAEARNNDFFMLRSHEQIRMNMHVGVKAEVEDSF